MRGACGLLAAALLGGVSGCLHPHGVGSPPPGGGVGVHGQPPIAVPPAGAVPRELDPITLPPYVIEAPDTLMIQVVQRTQVDDLDANGKAIIGNDGKAVKKDATKDLPVQAINGGGPFLVNPDGTVRLGFWGSVMVAGLTLDQAVEAIRQHLLKSEVLARSGVRPESLVVIVDVISYNSKRYYVITDGGGYGEQVYPFPVQGSEKVLDAIANINGLPAVASKRNIWVARRCPHPDQPWQILPVDWVGITQHGQSFTNYQILPGDRVYVKAQRLVTIDTALARMLSPIERMFGITLLGTSTVNQIQGRGNGFNNGF
ncbi:MAG: polysaccharide biosynthesis/export family protein [Gemmataceae bacterium]